MTKDPAFLFYPGDYLQDTQNLSPATQVSYDRIMCEHMRNICITQQQLKFFTKRLTDEEREELKMTLVKINGGFQIAWVAESIDRRRLYSESRRKNRSKTSSSYDPHMEDENEDVIKEEDKERIVKGKNGLATAIDLKVSAYILVNPPKNSLDDRCNIAKWMYDKFLAIHPKSTSLPKAELNRWSEDIRLMLEADKISRDDLVKVFEWALNDPFWKGNVAAPSGFRTKYDKISLKVSVEQETEIPKPIPNNSTP